MKFDWFKVYYEARNDAKLNLLSDKQHRIWFRLLCFAAEQGDARGSIVIRNEEWLAAEVANGHTEALRGCLAKLERFQIITIADGVLTFIHFAQRQEHPKTVSHPAAASAPRSGAERTANWRDRSRRKDECDIPVTCDAPVTMCDVTVTSHIPLEEERDLEKETTTATATRPPAIMPAPTREATRVARPELAALTERVAQQAHLAPHDRADLETVLNQQLALFSPERLEEEARNFHLWRQQPRVSVEPSVLMLKKFLANTKPRASPSRPDVAEPWPAEEDVPLPAEFADADEDTRARARGAQLLLKATTPRRDIRRSRYAG